MISEKTFIKNYVGFWNALFPLRNTFVKGVNLKCSQRQTNIELSTQRRRFSFVSEVGFQIFALCKEQMIPVDAIVFKNDLYQQVEDKCQKKFESFQDDDIAIRDSLSKIEFDDAMKIAQSLNRKFPESSIIVNPKFVGCSIIDTCYGDILTKDTLYEVKSVSRNFNISDFRQLITYCTLNYVSKQYNINSIGLYNPKRTMSYEIPLESFAYAVAGSSLSDIFWNIVNFISMDDVSN